MIASSRAQWVRSASPVYRAGQARLLAAMNRVESLPSAASGALLVGPREKPLGTILVESNRVCWGAAAGMSRRLRDILRSHCGVAISEDNLDAIYARCRLERKPLGEALVATGLVLPAQMRSAIKQHTVESLLHVDQALSALSRGQIPEWPMTWVDHAGHGYNPTYTFSAAEILAAAGALTLDETTAELIADHLQVLAATGCATVAFCSETEGTPLLVGVSSSLEISVQELLELATWGDAALSASTGFSPEVAHACTRSAQGGAVAWRYEGQRCAAICADGLALQRLIASLGNRSLSVVLATTMALLGRVRERETSKNNNQGD